MALTQISTEGIKNGTITGSDLATNVDLVDNQKIRFGTGNDLRIYHDGSNSYIQNSTLSSLYINSASHIYLANADNSEFKAKFHNNSSVQLFHDGNQKFETTSTGITATGSEHKFVNSSTGDLKLILEADTGNSDENNNPYIIFRQDGGGFGDFSVIGQNPQGINTENNSLVLANSTNAQGGIIFKTGSTNGYANATEKFRINTTGVLATGTEHKFTSGTSGDCTVIIEADTDNNNEDNNPKLIFRQDGGLDLGSIGMNFSNSSTGGTNNELYIAAATGEAAISFLTSTTTGYTNASERLRIINTGNVQIPVDSSSNADGRLQIGASQDLQLWHNGTDSFVHHQTGSGVLRLNTAAGGQVQISKNGPEYMAKFIPDGAVELYHNNVKKFETTSTGVRSQGTDNRFGSGSDLTNVNGNRQRLAIIGSSTDGAMLHIRGGSPAIFFDKSGTNFGKIFQDNVNLGFYAGVPTSEGTNILLLDANGSVQIPNDNAKLQIGAGQDLQVYHNGTKSIIDNNTGDLSIETTANEVHSVQSEFQVKVKGGDEDGLKVITDGAVELYHDNSKMLETASHGITLTNSIHIPDGMIAGFGDTSSPDLRIYHAGGSPGTNIIRGNTTSPLAFWTNGSQRMVIDANGSVGINVGNPGTYDPNAESLVIGEISGGDGHAGMTIVSGGTDKQGAIYFADGTGSSSYRGRIEYDHNTDTLNLGTSGTGQRMRINSSGFVTKPNQPMAALHGSNDSLPAQSPLPFDSIVYNIGSHWNNSTYKFLCPVAGYYYVTCHVVPTNLSTPHNVELYVINNAGTRYFLDRKVKTNNYSTNNFSVGGSRIIYAAANDNLWVQFHSISGSPTLESSSHLGIMLMA